MARREITVGILFESISKQRTCRIANDDDLDTGHQFDVFEIVFINKPTIPILTYFLHAQIPSKPEIHIYFSPLPGTYEFIRG